MLNCLDHFAVDPAITPVRATGRQLVTLCRSVCAEERAQILDPLMGSNCLTMCFIFFQLSSLHYIFLFTEIDAVLQHLGQSAARPGPHVVETSDSSADESEASHSRRRVRSKRTFKMKNVWGGGERSGSVLRDWSYRCSWQLESFLLSGLSKGCLGVDAWPS